LNPLSRIASLFRIPGPLISVVELEIGNVNDTFIVTCDRKEHKPVQFILQRINPDVFPDPASVVRNMMVVSNHVQHKTPIDSGRRWEIPEVIPCKNGNPCHVDNSGNTWRMISYIENSRTLQTITTPIQSEEMGYALGRFHFTLADIKANQLVDTLPGFHITPLYLKKYDGVLQNVPRKDKAEHQFCRQFIEKRRKTVGSLEFAKQKGRIHDHIIHGDPKANNFMFHEESDAAIGLIDLDTVKPGLIHYDIGDCLRSCCNTAGEETTDLEAVDFDLDLAECFFKGYLQSAREIITPEDRKLFPDAVRLMTFELGLRFYCDYLEGNIYFKTERENHNLERALVQFRLTEIIESKEKQLFKIVKDLA
jgi:Ser/Thr protein kinase RdoA (MazF antagonist)